SKVDQDRLHMKADRVFRQLGNGSARGRLTSNLEQRAERRPRCLLISTGEDVPRGQSLKARCVVLTMNDPLTRGEAAHRLSELQQDARSGLFANAMAGFIEWLAPQIESIQSCMPDLIATEREQLRIEGHARAGTNTANMMLGIKLFLRFACESGALTAQEAQAYLTRCASALTEIAQEASRENTHDTPSEQWRRLIVAALTNKSAHLVSANGDNPGLEYGWTKSVRSIEVAGEARTEESYKGGGSQIGWIDGDDIYLLPVAAYKAARAIGNATGDDIATLEPTLRKFLAKDGLLASTDLEKARKTVTIRRRLEKIQRDVLHIKKGSLYNPLSPITSLDSGQNSGSESACEADSGVSQEAVSQDLPHSQKSEKTPPIDGVKAHYIAEDTGKEVFSL
ncbi:MAG: hypothetical protein J2P36_36310, partial [Ktedonobacteraceae bacterium]|nr:hypothetical protein [Ktedonobacteraceae bacterium]